LAEAQRQSHLRVLPGGKQTRTSWADLDETLEGLEGKLADVRTSDEPEQWPEIDKAERLRQLIWQRAFYFGLNGGKRKEILGSSGALTKLIRAMVKKAIATISQRGVERAEELNRTIKSSGTRSKAQVKDAAAHDKRTAALDGQIDEVGADIRQIDADYDALSPGQRSGNIVGKEAFGAAAATGLADGTAFILTLNGIGGALWLRLVIAATLALALNVAVMAAGRTLAGLWVIVRDSSKAVRLSLVTAMLVSLASLIALTLFSAGDFRRDALANLGEGLPADPRFLVWLGVTAAFGSTMTLGWWHYSSDGARLSRRRRKLEAERAQLEQERKKHLAAEVRARDRAFLILADAQTARGDRALLDQMIASQIAQQEAEGEALLEVAKEGFAEGQHARRETAARGRTVPATVDPETERAIDDTIAEILTEPGGTQEESWDSVAHNGVTRVDICDP
jgi:hypothetical protein